MKQLLFVLLFPTICVAQQPTTFDSASYTFTGIEKVEGIPALVLRSRAKFFLYQTFNSLTDVIAYDDPDGGVLMLTCNIGFKIKRPRDKDSIYGGYLVTGVKLLFHQGTYKYYLFNFTHYAGSSKITFSGGILANIRTTNKYMEPAEWQTIRISAKDYIQAFINQLTTAMRSDDLDPDNPDFR